MKNTNKNENQKSVQSFAYYSRLLKEPFDTVEELNEAEEAYYAKQKAKEVKNIVEDAAKKIKKNPPKKNPDKKDIRRTESRRCFQSYECCA